MSDPETGPSSAAANAGRGAVVWGIAAVLLATAVLAVRVGHFHRKGLVPDIVLDDSYISFRYARNLARGEGLVYNVGERVEGYTNFLWTVAAAGALAAGFEPEPATEAMAAAAALGSIVLLALLARRSIRGPLAAPARLLPPLLYAAVGSQAYHVVSGMETLLFVFLVLAGFACLELGRAAERGKGFPGRVALLAGALFGLAALTRPEGFLYAGIGGLCALWNGWRGSAEESALFPKLRAPLLLSGGFLAFVLPHLAWRFSYYGHPLPNTYYAKVSGPLLERLPRGWETLARGMEDWAIWPLVLLALAALPAVRRDRFWAWCFGIAVATFASFVLVGGDFVHSFGPRMLMPAFPFVLLLAAEGLRRLVAAVPGTVRIREVGATLTTVAVLGLAAHALSQPWIARGGKLGGLVMSHGSWRATGAWLNRHTPPDALVATTAAGILPYVSDRPTLDMFGLTDEHIAHHAEIDPKMPPAHGKMDPEYVLERRPDYLHVMFLTPDGLPETAGLGNHHERVLREYELVAQAKAKRGPRIGGRWLIEVDRFRPDLHRKGYQTGLYRRRDLGRSTGGEASGRRSSPSRVGGAARPSSSR